MGAAEYANEYFVYDICAILDMPVVNSVWRNITHITAEHMRKNLKRLFA